MPEKRSSGGVLKVSACIAWFVVIALMNPLSAFICNVTFPSSCDCTTTTGKVEVVASGHIVYVYLTIGTSSITKTFVDTERTAICNYCNSPTDTKKAGVQPVTGKTWGTATSCSDLEAVCC